VSTAPVEMEERSRLDSMAYVTVLSTDTYLPGVLVLDESLRRCKARYGLYAVVGDEVGARARRTLDRAGIRRIDSRSLDIPPEIRIANESSDFHKHWAGVFDKLLVFSLCEFRKIVYIDCDVLILRNIDELFDKPHMSAVLADLHPGDDTVVDLNAGLMVLEPEPDLTDRLTATLPDTYEQEKQWRAAAGRPPSMGVQSVINMFWRDWITRTDLHLDAKYNVLANNLDYYVTQLGYRWRGPEGIRVLHYVGETKPWMRTGVRFLRWGAELLVRRRFRELAATIACKAVLARAQLRLR
jgi:glycogenin glucosyltransferase